MKCRTIKNRTAMHMKKEYVSPLIELAHIDMEYLLSGSGVDGNLPNETVEFGRVDEDGEKDPGARRNRDIWDDEIEE